MICLENIVTETGTEPITEYTTNIADVASKNTVMLL